jgi:glutaminyl-peptide cyclotransferase
MNIIRALGSLIMRGLSGQTLFLGAVVTASLLVGGYLLFAPPGPTAAAPPETISKFTLDEIRERGGFDGKEAYEYLKQLCAIGPRPSGSAGMVAQQKLITDYFKKLGAQVSWQEFRERHPQDGSPVPMANMIVQWHPERMERILLCTHYDTRPVPDEDQQNPKGVFIGANDGASGVAVLMELGKWMPKLESKYGVDFVLFDAEEFVFRKGTGWNDRGDPMFLGAKHFAEEYVTQPPPYKYRWGVLLDMVGGDNIQLYKEGNSVAWRDTRPLVDDIWRLAYNLGVREFIPRVKDDIEDDHLRLHDIGKIPTCDIIDFSGYRRYWHTQQDTKDHCSPLALAKVGWVMLEWLKQAK